jgi:Protein of unknown function (DUF1800)
VIECCGYGCVYFEITLFNRSGSDLFRFPFQLGLSKTYIGDGYPLCVDLPSRPFLKKGATFRLLGSRKSSQLLLDPKVTVSGVPLERIRIDAESNLRTKLCESGRQENVDEGGCYPAVTVVLDQDLDCTGVECDLEDLRSFEVNDGIWYEYVRQPCVQYSFFNNPQTVKHRHPATSGMCADPSTLSASVVCCDGSSTRLGTREEYFAGERFTFKTAEERCKALNKDVCIDSFPSHDDCENIAGCHNQNYWYWSSSSCAQFVRINRDGLVSMVHRPEAEAVLPDPQVNETSPNFFQVDWISSDRIISFLDDFVASCEAYGCEIMGDDTCKCMVPSYSVEDQVIYNNLLGLTSAHDVLASAKTGSPRPTGEGERIDLKDGYLIKYPANDALSENTVFEIVNSNGQTHFRKNVISIAGLGDEGLLAFRNPVSFYLLSDPHLRDAQYETDAALEHFFYHRNLAPFLAIHFAKRFGNSNPSPRLVDVVATAFRKGRYESSEISFGSGRYGCLAATLASLLLDRETSLDLDPVSGSLEEPLLKFVKVLRSLEYQADNKSPLLRTKQGLSLLGLIGQQPYNSRR